MVHAVILTRITRLFIKTPKVISTAHSINEGGKIRELMYRYTDFLSDVNTNVSLTGLNLYLKKKIFKSKENSIFIPNGISLIKTSFSDKTKNSLSNKFDPNQSNFIWLAIGRLELAKDYINLIDSAKILEKENSNFKILIAGEGTLRRIIEKKIEGLELENNIILLGRRNDISDLLQYADAFVMSSAWEGLPIAILEAATYELPSVVTNVGGCKEIITNNKNGYIVPPKNSVSLANAMLKMMSINQRQRTEFTTTSLLKIKQTYNIDKVVDNWLTIYK
jgi:glycosyltransferase involved in cell wall biosynthesis